MNLACFFPSSKLLSSAHGPSVYKTAEAFSHIPCRQLHKYIIWAVQILFPYISVWILYEKVRSPYSKTSKLSSQPGSVQNPKSVSNAYNNPSNTIPLCFFKAHIYDISLYSQYKSAQEKPSPQEVAAIFTTDPQ